MKSIMMKNKMKYTKKEINEDQTGRMKIHDRIQKLTKMMNKERHKKLERKE